MGKMWDNEKNYFCLADVFKRNLNKWWKRGEKVFKMILFGWRNLLKINVSKQWEETYGRDMSKRYQGMRKRWERRENEPFCRGELFPRPPGAGPVKNHRASVAPATNMCEEEWQLRGICANVLCSKKINKMSNFNDFGNTIFLRQRVEKQLSCSSSRYVWENSRFSQKKYKTCLENIRHIHM